MKVKLLLSSIPTSIRNGQRFLCANAAQKINLFLVAMLFFVSINIMNAQLDCSGNVPIENLANGMDYTIVSDGAGNVDITVTVVDNPVGLVGFLGGPGNPISFPDATGTFTYNLTGLPAGDPYTLDMFFNWTAGGAGNSETVECATAASGGLDCSGNVPIENLANGMDYTIVSDGAGNVDITVTVVDNPVGLVGFLGGPGNPISFPDATGTFTYNLTGLPAGDPYTLDMFFNWTAGGAGNSETVICELASDCTAAATACATCPEAQVSIPMTSGEAFNDAGRFDGGGDPIFPDWDPAANTGTLTIEAGSNSTFVVSGVNNIEIPDDATDLCFTADLEAISGDYPFLLEFRIEQKDPVTGAEVGRLVFDQNIDGTGVCSIGGNLADGTPSIDWSFDPANFDYALVWAIADFDGTAPTEDLVIEVSNVTLLACVSATCTLAAADCATCAGDQISIPMTDGTAFNDAGRFDGGGAPIFPDYDPVTNMGTLTIEAGSNSTFVVSGVNLIMIPDGANDLCFTADLNVISGDYPFTMEFRIEMKDPVSGDEIERLTLNQSIDGPGACSIGGNVSDGVASAGFVVDPANFDYALVWALADFDGTPPAEDLIVQVSNVTLLACVPSECTIEAAACTACTECDATFDVSFPNLLNLSNSAVQPNFTSTGTSMGGTLTLPAGSTDVFTVAAGQRLVIPNALEITDICATADVDVISGSFPFELEFRVFNASTGAQLNFNQMVDGAGMCSIGGSLSDAIDASGFTWDNSCLEFVVATAFFPGDGSTLSADRVIDISNMTLSICTAESEQPEITCPSQGANLFANPGFDTGDLTGWTLFGNGGVEQNVGDPMPSAFLFSFAGGFGASGLFQSFPVNEGEFYCIGADLMAIACDGGNSQIFGTDDFFELNIRYLDAAGIALNGPAFCNGAPFGPLCGTGFQTQMSGLSSNDLDSWLKTFGCFQAPEGAVSVEAILAINDGGTPDGGAVLVDNATFNQVIPQVFDADDGLCTAEVTIVDPVATDNCGIATFTNDFNGTDMASGAYPVGQTIVTYTATDEAGNEACCAIVIEVEDNQGPELLDCIGSVQSADGNCEFVGSGGTFTIADNCPGTVTLDEEYIDEDGNTFLELTFELAPGAYSIGGDRVYPLGVNTVNLTVTDENGATSTCTFTVEVIDDTDPVAMCQDVTLSLDENGEATIAGGTTTMVAGLELGAPEQLASDIISTVCGPVAAAADICDCPAGFVATGIEGIESTNFNGLVGEFNIICRQLLPTGNLGMTSMVSCSNGTANTTTALGPVETAGDDVLVAAQSRIGCAVDRITVYSAPLAQVIGGSNIPNTEVGFLVGSNGGTGGSLRPLRTAPNNNLIVGMQTFDNQGNPSYVTGIAWRYAPIEEVLVESASAFLIDAGSNDNCTDDADLTLTVSQADFTCDDLIAGQASTDIVVTLIATDAAGNMSMCEATVTLMDDTAPSITCPNNINIALDAGDCDRIVDYTVLAEDNCGLVPDAEGNTVIQTAGLPSGSVFPIGTTTNSFEITDPTGNVSMCSFDVVVVENPDPVTALSCNGNLNISLDQNCEAFIGADQILEGGGYGCYDDYIVEIEGITGQTIFAPGTYTITITDPETGNSCWSEVTVEDKLEPTLVCTECPPGATSMIELPFTGTLDADSPIWTRPFGQVGNCNPSGAGVDVPYQTHEFLVVTGADSDFENVSFTAPSADFFMVLYQDSFDPLNPCGNMVINNDDGGGGLLSQFDVMLESGVQYILVATTFNNNGNDFGDYVIELDSEAVLIDAPAECLFKCFDEAAILSGVMPVPSPVAMDNCIANLPTTFTDEVTEGAICGSKVITRTFSIIGSDGNVITSCVAEYQLFAAQFSDFTPPPAAVVLPCGTGTSPEEIEAFFDDPTTNDITNPNCPLDIIENNEGTAFAYLTYPTLGCDGVLHPQAVDNNQCGFFTTYSDQVIPSCGAACGSENVKVIRTWTILDWCNPDDAPFTYIQVIKSEDTEAPTIEVANDFTVGVNPWNCLGDFSLPAPTLLHDLCSEEITYTVSGPVGTTLLAPNTTSNPSDYWVVFGAPKGIASFTYTAADCCGNTSSAELLVNIFDTTPPVPVATENIIINLTTNGQLDENGFAQGFAKLFTSSVDDGSYDGCSGVKIEIARSSDACDESGNTTFNADGHPDDGSPNPNASNYDPDGGEFVKFCCADIDQVDPVTGVEYGLVEVRMRVFDDGNMTGFYGDFVDNNGDGDVLDAGEYDNFNETWVTVRVEGKAIASIVCPPDVTLACDMDYTDPAMIGTATTLSLCGSESVSTSFTPQLNACGIGFVIATYTVEGSSPAISCSQRITIENPYPTFDPDGIRFPRDLPTSPTGQIDCDDDVTFDPPTWTAGACDFIGYTEQVDTFFFEVDQETGVPSEACFKILRRFTVIDWCVYDETNGQDGLYEGNQTIKITDREAPVLLACAPEMFEVDGDCVRESTVLTNMAEDNGDCASDWLKWQVFVDTWADGVVDYEYSSFLPTNDSNINNDTNGNGINDRYLAPTSSGEEVSVTVAEVIESSMYNHEVTWKVTDGCGNVASCTTTFMVVDKKAPTPYCVSLSTALMQNSQPVELWAIDFDLGAFDNCTDQENLRFTFSSTPPEDDSSYDSDLRSSAQSFGTPGVIPVNVYVWDEKGNADFCTVSLTVIDNGGTGLRVAGITATELGNGVSDADVVLEANLEEYPRTSATDETGAYAFEGNPSGVDYELTVNKNDNHTNGVSTLDLVLIQRHIVGFGDLDSPYKVIAADINSDEKVSGIDVVELRKLILGVQDEFTQNTSWRFVDSEQEFADMLSPWPIDENRTISDLSTDLNAENFVAVKIGDVNATATHNVVGASTEVRSSNTMLLELNDRAVSAGDLVEIAFSSKDFRSVSGLQMTMEFDGLAFNDVAGRSISMGASNVGVIREDMITISWNTITEVSSTEDLFVITALATRDGNVSEMIKVTDRVIKPEAYTSTTLSAGQESTLEINNIELGIRGGSAIVAVSELMQNEPNPFKESTMISFKLATAGKATLTIRDVAGKVIRTVNGEYTAGLNTITLNKTDLNTVGVLYYTLESGEFNQTMKMIVVE